VESGGEAKLPEGVFTVGEGLRAHEMAAWQGAV